MSHLQSPILCVVEVYLWSPHQVWPYKVSCLHAHGISDLPMGNGPALQHQVLSHLLLPTGSWHSCNRWFVLPLVWRRALNRLHNFRASASIDGMYFASSLLHISLSVWEPRTYVRLAEYTILDLNIRIIFVCIPIYAYVRIFGHPQIEISLLSAQNYANEVSYDHPHSEEVHCLVQTLKKSIQW